MGENTYKLYAWQRTLSYILFGGSAKMPWPRKPMKERVYWGLTIPED